MVMLNYFHGPPAKLAWVLNLVNLRFASTVIDHVKPVVFLESHGGVVFIVTQGHFTNARSALNFNEPNINCRRWVFWMRFARYQIKSSTLVLHTLDPPT